MSIVGPHPHAVAHNEQYRQLIEATCCAIRVKPGITGWAQINGWRGETDTLEKMENASSSTLSTSANGASGSDIKIVFLDGIQRFRANKAAY